MILDCAKSLLAGAACGAVFAVCKLPAPAPPVLAGLVGIFGVYLGYMLVGKI